MIQLFISFIIEDELLLFEIIFWYYQHYQNEIKDIDLSDINLHDKFVCENQISKFEFRFE